MDPLTFFPTEIVDLILKSLSIKELLNASLVSKTWYEIIGSSSSIMKRINFKLASNEIEEILTHSSRLYENVEIAEASNSINIYQEAIASNTRSSWKRVKLSKLFFASTKQLNDFLGIFESKIEVLEMDHISVLTLGTSNFNDFSNLKVLKLKTFGSDVFNIFTKCINLKELCITSKIDSSNSKIVNNLLEKNLQLKVMEISSQALSKPFAFKLQTLRISEMCLNSNFNEFLKTQFETLEILSLPQVANVNLELIFQMPKLRELDVGSVKDVDFKKLHLHTNGKIEKLSYRDTENKLNAMKSIIGAVPNMNRLQCFSMSQEMVEFLSKTAKKLEVIHMRTLKSIDLSCEQLFPKLKKASIEILSSQLEDHLIELETIPNTNLNPMARLILASNYITLY